MEDSALSWEKSTFLVSLDPYFGLTRRGTMDRSPECQKHPGEEVGSGGKQEYTR